MKDLIILKNAQNIRFDKSDIDVILQIYFTGNDFITYSKHIAGLDINEQKRFLTKYEDVYIKIKTALTNKEDFVEVEL